MQSQFWITLLKRIPLVHQEGMVLMSQAGVEMTIQKVLRMEEEFLVLRGRLSGSADTGRVFFVPYHQIIYLGFQREIKESLIGTFFGEPGTSGSMPALKIESLADKPVNPGVQSALDPVGPAEPELGEAPASQPESRSAIQRRSGLIARLRARQALLQRKQSPS